MTMAITIYPVTPDFAAEIGDVDLSRTIEPSDVDAIEKAFAKYAVLIFPDQHLSQDQHLDFAKYFGPLETTIALYRKDQPLRVRKEFADVSNLSPDNEVWGKDSRQRMFQLGNRLWHTDSSFKRLPARASLLYARAIPATQRQFVYTHRWRVHDLVIWDNRCTMHRGTDFDDLRWKRDMQRATVCDVANSCEQAGIAIEAA
jgi:alpha-ketoglutarate-dependent 2,4-dichlorophenoxyacetate dioxygenase